MDSEINMKLNINKENYFRPSQKSPSSPNSLNDIDEYLDFDKPPIYNSPKCLFKPGNYASQLVLRNTQTSSTNGNGSSDSNIDSGFDSIRSAFQSHYETIHSSPSSGNQQGILSQQLISSVFEMNKSVDLSESSSPAQKQTTLQNFCEQGTISEQHPNLSSNVSVGDLIFSQNETTSIRSCDLSSDSSIFDRFNSNPEMLIGCTNGVFNGIGGNINGSSHSDSFCSYNEKIQEFMSSSAKSLGILIHPEIEPILRLFSEIKSQYSDGAFVYALASNMCKDIYPANSNISLKTALLLSIVSCNNQSDGSPISILAITRDSAMVASIMGHIGNVAKRFVCISDDLKFNGKNTKTNTIEANSLLMARNGICFIGDWMGLNVASLNYLRNVIDSGRVTCDSSSNIEYALKCGIWMYWTGCAKQMNQNYRDLSIISMLFGLPIVLDESPNQTVIDFLFEKYTTKSVFNEQSTPEYSNDSKINDNGIKAFLNLISNITTRFDCEALALLKYYFIVTRTIRPNILTPKSFDVLQRLSECHAKFCLRCEVLKIDVIYSIELFEQFILSVYAGEVPTKPMPNTSASTLQQVDENMTEFKKWLDNYLSTFNDNVHSFFQD